MAETPRVEVEVYAPQTGNILYLRIALDIIIIVTGSILLARQIKRYRKENRSGR